MPLFFLHACAGSVASVPAGHPWTESSRWCRFNRNCRSEIVYCRAVGRKFEQMRPNQPQPLTHPHIIIVRYCTQVTVVAMFCSFYQRLINYNRISKQPVNNNNYNRISKQPVNVTTSILSLPLVEAMIRYRLLMFTREQQHTNILMHTALIGISRACNVACSTWSKKVPLCYHLTVQNARSCAAL